MLTSDIGLWHSVVTWPKASTRQCSCSNHRKNPLLLRYTRTDSWSCFNFILAFTSKPAIFSFTPLLFITYLSLPYRLLSCVRNRLFTATRSVSNAAASVHESIHCTIFDRGYTTGRTANRDSSNDGTEERTEKGRLRMKRRCKVPAKSSRCHHQNQIFKMFS